MVWIEKAIAFSLPDDIPLWLFSHPALYFVVRMRMQYRVLFMDAETRLWQVDGGIAFDLRR